MIPFCNVYAGIKHIFVRSIDGSLTTCRLKSSTASLKELQLQVYATTGIPPELQQVLYGTKLLQSQSDLQDLPDEATVSLKLKVVGGGNCDICYSAGLLYECAECDQLLCTECKDRVHRHPKRAHHEITPVVESAEPITEPWCSDLYTHSSQDEYDMTPSPSTEKSFADALLVATLAEQFGLTTLKPFQKEP